MRYNVKDIDKVQETEFCCPVCLTEELITSLQFTREFEGIDLYAHADVVTDLLRVLLNAEVDGDAFTLGLVDIDGTGDDYSDEYILSINYDNTIWVQKAWNDYGGDYKLFDTEAYITYVHGDCSSKILQKLTKDEKCVMIFDFEEE